MSGQKNARRNFGSFGECPRSSFPISDRAVFIGLTAQGQVNVLWPGDPVFASSLNSPGSEGAGNAIDGTQAKYLNFDSVNDAQPSGFAVTPSIGPTLVTSMEVESANDSPDRDPREVTLEGSNDNILSFSEGTWTLIADIQVPAFTNRFQSQAFTFANTNRYSSYRWSVRARTARLRPQTGYGAAVFVPRCATKPYSEPLLCKRPARSSFQITLEIGCSPTITERHCGFDPPGNELGRVGHLAAVVSAQPIAQVVREPNIEVPGETLTLKNIDVREVHF